MCVCHIILGKYRTYEMKFRSGHLLESGTKAQWYTKFQENSPGEGIQASVGTPIDPKPRQCFLAKI